MMSYGDIMLAAEAQTMLTRRLRVNLMKVFKSLICWTQIA